MRWKVNKKYWKDNNQYINPRPLLYETKANLCVKDDEITNLLDKVDMLKTESEDNIIFV